MSNVLTDMRNLRFLLYEVLKADEVTRYPFFADHSRETFDMALDAAYQLAQEVFWPSFQECDRIGVAFDGKQVRVPEAVHEIWRHCKEGGWFAPVAACEFGGQQFPHSLYAAALFLFNCANTTAAMYVSGAYGAGHLIDEFGSPEMKAKYLPPLYTGEWGGTMALTEPDVGTSVGDIKTTAVKAADGDYYLLKGTKRFISSGDQDITENIIHPVLARIKDAPPGVKGLSLFLVPKYRVNGDGSIGAFNDVVTAGVEHKMGLKASATCTLIFGEHDDCRAWLIGEANNGLQYMFQLMNRARIYVGIQAVAGASAAYQCALQYARERLQGRDVTCRDPLAPQVPLIEHTDVRNMLLRQKAFLEGVLGMILYCAKSADIREHIDNEAEKERLQQLLELLTPCCKAYVSDGAFESIRLAMQCLGGAGYCEEFPIAQMLRDNKVFSIYEGANGIQALDLLGRKVPMEQGAAVRTLMAEITRAIDEASAMPPLQPLAGKVQVAMNEVGATLMHLAGVGLSGDIPLYVANATAFLDMFSRLIMAWQLLLQAVAAQRALDAGAAEESFYRGKIETVRFYVNQELPHALSTASLLRENERTALDFKPEWFS